MVTKNLSLQHVLRPSTAKGKAPLILMLHGYGSNENDLFSFANEFPEKYLVVSARAPLSLPPYGHAWYEINFDADMGKFTNDEQATASRDLIVKFLSEITAQYYADPDQVTLLGFSQGAILSYAIALSYPEKIKHIVALSGYVHPSIFIENYEKKDFSNLCFYLSHGNQDQVIPVEWARKNKPFLDNLDISNTYSEFPVGHGVSPENLKELKAWLAKQN